MPNNKPKILVLGATGQVGKNVISHLITNDKVEVIAAARSPEKAKDLGVPVVYLDLDKPESIAPALKGIDRAFLATGYTIDMMRQSKDFLNIAKEAGVKHIVHLGGCGDNDTRVAHYAWHQFIERYIEWCGFSFTHLRPEIFMQNMLGYGGESYVKNGVIRHYIGKARWSWVDIEDVAAVAAACLLDPEKHNGQTYRLGYQAATYDEIAAIFTEVIGQPFSYEARPPEEFYRNVLAAGAEPAYMKGVFDSYTELTNGTAVKPDEVFDNLPAIIRDLLAQGCVGQLRSVRMHVSMNYFQGPRSTDLAWTIPPENFSHILSIYGGHFMDMLFHVVGAPRTLSAIVAPQFPAITLVETGEIFPNNTPDQVLVIGTLANGGVFSIQIEGGKRNGSGLQIDITGMEGDLKISNTLSFGNPEDNIVEGSQGDGETLRVLPMPGTYQGLPASALDASVLDLAHLYAAYANDRENGTHDAPTFADAVKMHKLIDLITEASSTGTRQSVKFW